MLRPRAKVRTSTYLNDLIEQDHRGVKQRLYPMPGLKSFGDGAVRIGGIALAQEMREGGFDTSAVIVRGGARVPRVWSGVPAG